jgi:hypothetical protein
MREFMVKDIFEKVILNANIITNINYYENVREKLQQDCEHIPIILGESTTTTVVDDGIESPKKYKKCLICGADVSLSGHFDYEFDARNFLRKDNETFEDWEEKYLEILNLFQEICRKTDDKEKAFLILNQKLNNNNSKIIKKSNTKCCEQ